MADYKARILSTRPLAAVLLEQAAARDILIESFSFIGTTSVPDQDLRIPDLSRHPLTVVFTSMNAVAAVAANLGNQPDSPAGETADSPRPYPEVPDRPAGDISGVSGSHSEIPAHPAVPWRIFCIGHATQQLVREHFGEDCIAGTADSAAALADTIIEQLKRGILREVTFFCGDQRRDELPERLREQGIRVNELIVYKTILTPHKVEPVYDGIVFFSPSAVHSFFSVNSIPAGTRLFAIGRTTADTIRTYTTHPAILGGSPEKEALIRQVIDYYNKPTTRDPKTGKLL